MFVQGHLRSFKVKIRKRKFTANCYNGLRCFVQWLLPIVCRPIGVIVQQGKMPEMRAALL